MARYAPSVLDAARMDRVELFTSAVLLAELEDVLHREKFAQQLAQTELAPRDLILGYAALATIVEPGAIDPVVLDDPDDDAVLACAVAIGAEVIVSGDSHLLDLEEYQGIPILSAAELLAGIQTPESSPESSAR